jgi:hypothetical protein
MPPNFIYPYPAYFNNQSTWRLLPLQQNPHHCRHLKLSAQGQIHHISPIGPLRSSAMARLFLLHIFLIGQVPLTLAFLSSLPECAQSPSNGLFDTSSCASYTDETTILLCVCSNTGFLSDAAAAIYKQCGCADLNTTAQVVTQDCESLGTTSALSESAIIQAGCGSTTCPPPTPSSGLSAGDIAGIVGGVIGGITLIVALLQLAAALHWIPKRVAPSRYIQSLCCSCFTGGEKQTEDAGEGKPQPNTTRDGPPEYPKAPHQEISSTYGGQWDMNTPTMIR